MIAGLIGYQLIVLLSNIIIARIKRCCVYTMLSAHVPKMFAVIKHVFLVFRTVNM